MAKYHKLVHSVFAQYRITLLNYFKRSFFFYFQNGELAVDIAHATAKEV